MDHPPEHDSSTSMDDPSLLHNSSASETLFNEAEEMSSDSTPPNALELETPTTMDGDVHSVDSTLPTQTPLSSEPAPSADVTSALKDTAVNSEPPERSLSSEHGLLTIIDDNLPAVPPGPLPTVFPTLQVSTDFAPSTIPAFGNFGHMTASPSTVSSAEGAASRPVRARTSSSVTFDASSFQPPIPTYTPFMPLMPLPAPATPGMLPKKKKEKTKCGCSCLLRCNCDCTCKSHCYCRILDKQTNKWIQRVCDGNCRKFKGRNLIVSIDGTSNQFGNNNTNVVELHSRILRNYGEDDSHEQLKCYLSGIGTALPPSPWAISYWKVKFGNWIDLAVAWRFAIIVQDAYRWLMDHYRPGDRIFLFGFSRGAYQVRTLAGIIHTLGLLEAGNKSLIPFAYDLYTGSYQKIRTNDKGTQVLVDNFKETFSHTQPSVQVHFVGAWDTVSSIGVIRQMPLPFTNRADHVCYFRHALALDERRVKFIPEYLASSESPFEDIERIPDDGFKRTNRPSLRKGPLSDHSFRSLDVSDGRRTPRLNDTQDQLDFLHTTSRSDTKEVWFAGTHSDIGGGYRTNITLNNASIPLLWMENQASRAGLMLKARESGGEWNWTALGKELPTESLTAGWYIFEDLPITSWQFFTSRPPRWHVLDSCTVSAFLDFLEADWPRIQVRRWLFQKRQFIEQMQEWLSEKQQPLAKIHQWLLEKQFSLGILPWIQETRQSLLIRQWLLLVQPSILRQQQARFTQIMIALSLLSDLSFLEGIQLLYVIQFVSLPDTLSMQRLQDIIFFLLFLRWIPNVVLSLYRPRDDCTLFPHQGRGRIIRSGQLIHASVAFKRAIEYEPKASLEGFQWSSLIGKGKVDKGVVGDMSWSEEDELKGILEMDFFDCSEVLEQFFRQEAQSSAKRSILKRLALLANSSSNADTIAQNAGFITQLVETIRLPEPYDPHLRIACADCLSRTVQNAHDVTDSATNIVSVLDSLAEKLDEYISGSVTPSLPLQRSYIECLLWILHQSASGIIVTSQAISTIIELHIRNIARLLGDPYEMIRILAAKTLASVIESGQQIGSNDWHPSACQDLLQLLKGRDTDREAREASFRCFSRLKVDDKVGVVKDLAAIIDTPDYTPATRFFAICSLVPLFDGGDLQSQDKEAISETKLYDTLLRIVYNDKDHMGLRLIASDALAKLLENDDVYTEFSQPESSLQSQLKKLVKMLFSELGIVDLKQIYAECDAKQLDFVYRVSVGSARVSESSVALMLLYRLSSKYATCGEYMFAGEGVQSITSFLRKKTDSHALRWMMAAMQKILNRNEFIRKLTLAANGLHFQLMDMLDSSQHCQPSTIFWAIKYLVCIHQDEYHVDVSRDLFDAVWKILLSAEHELGVRLSAFDTVYYWINRSDNVRKFVSERIIRELANLVQAFRKEDLPFNSALEDALRKCHGLKESLMNELDIPDDVYPPSIGISLLRGFAYHDDLQSVLIKADTISKMKSILSSEDGHYTLYVQKRAAYFVEEMASNIEACSEILRQDIVTHLLILHKLFIAQDRDGQLYTGDALRALYKQDVTQTWLEESADESIRDEFQDIVKGPRFVWQGDD